MSRLASASYRSLFQTTPPDRHELDLAFSEERNRWSSANDGSQVEVLLVIPQVAVDDAQTQSGRKVPRESEVCAVPVRVVGAALPAENRVHRGADAIGRGLVRDAGVDVELSVVIALGQREAGAYRVREQAGQLPDRLGDLHDLRASIGPRHPPTSMTTVSVPGSVSSRMRPRKR